MPKPQLIVLQRKWPGWIEDFESGGEVNSGTAGGSVGGDWNTITPSGGVGSFLRMNAGGFGGIFLVDDTGNEGVWQTDLFNISAFGEVAIEITMGGLDADPADYVQAYYGIDGGPKY